MQAPPSLSQAPNLIGDFAFQKLPRRLLRVILASIHHGYLAVRKHHLAEAYDFRAALGNVADKGDLVSGFELSLVPAKPGHRGQAGSFGGPFFDFAVGARRIEPNFRMRIHE